MKGLKLLHTNEQVIEEEIQASLVIDKHEALDTTCWEGKQKGKKVYGENDVLFLEYKDIQIKGCKVTEGNQIRTLITFSCTSKNIQKPVREGGHDPSEFVLVVGLFDKDRNLMTTINMGRHPIHCRDFEKFTLSRDYDWKYHDLVKGLGWVVVYPGWWYPC